jgi:membrane protein
MERQSMRIPGLGDLSVIEVGKRAFRDFQDDDMDTYAAALTYRFLLALFPFLIFLLTLLDALRLEDFFTWMLDQARTALAADAYSQFSQIIDQIRAGAGGGLLSFGLITALWAAAAGVRSTMHALNVAYDVEEERSLWKKYLMSVVFTVGLAAMIIAAVALMLLGPQSAEWLAGQIGLGDVVVTLWNWLRIPAAILLMMLAVALIYYFFPNVDQPFKIVSPGSVFAVLAWLVATVGFSIYVSNFGNYNATYGSLGGAIALMFYFFISAATLLLGAEVNAVLYKAKAAGPEDNVDEGDRQEVAREVNRDAA